MKDIEVIPAIMPTVNWKGLSLFCKDKDFPDPIKALDENRIKHSDPDALIVGLDAAVHCYLGFVIFCPSVAVDNISFIIEYQLTLKIVAWKENNDLALLTTGHFEAWRRAILLACTADKPYMHRVIFNKIFEVFETSGFKRHFKQHKQKTLKDGSFILCS